MTPLKKDLMQNKSTNLMISNMKLHKNLQKSSADLNYKFLEKRNYIQGVVALDGMLKCCSMLLPELKSKTYKILEAKIFSEINFGTTAVAYMKNENLKLRKKPVALIKIKYKSKMLVCYLYKNQKNLNKNFREAKDIYGKHILKIQIKKQVSICKIKRIITIIDLIRAIEECQRDIIKLENPKFLKQRWCYLTNLIVNEKKLKNINQIKFYNKKILKSKNSIFDIRQVDFCNRYINTKPEFCFNAK